MSGWLVGQDGRYLGDGVYASHDGYQVWLQTMEGHRIALEPEVLEALVGYVRDMREKARAWNPECKTCAWIKANGGQSRLSHFCGPEFSDDIHTSQIAAQKAGEVRDAAGE